MSAGARLIGCPDWRLSAMEIDITDRTMVICIVVNFCGDADMRSLESSESQ